MKIEELLLPRSPQVKTFGFYELNYQNNCIKVHYNGCSERSAPLAEKNSAAGTSDFSVRGAARRHFSWQVAQHFRRKF
jgi:hypothetical protein